MPRESEEALERLLTGLSDLEVREMCLAALRQWRRERPGLDSFSMHGELGRYFVPLLVARRDAAHADANALKEAFITARDKPRMQPVVEFMAWFIRAGLGFPQGAGADNFPVRFRLTRAGSRLLDTAEDHPLVPGSIQRMVARCTNMPAEIASLFADAHACIDYGLLRPAVATMGLAYEVAIEAVADALIALTLLAPDVADASAARRLTAVRTYYDGLPVPRPPQERDDHLAIGLALDYANALRRRRNDASHTLPTYGFDDRAETEELLVSALRHVPNLWRLR